MSARVAVIGDGQMGLVTAGLLAEKGEIVSLWGPFPEAVADLRKTRRSPDRLPGFVLPQEVNVTPRAAECLDGIDLAVNAIPSQYVRPVWEKLRRFVHSGLPIISVSKGIEDDTLLRPLQVIADVLTEPRDLSARPMVCLSGPTIAAELAEKKPATMVAASGDEDAALRAQDLLTTTSLRIYTHDDVTGVEIAGAVKNVIALAAGMVDGLDLGYNAKSALLARGLAEITRLGVALGANRETFFGVAGVGDLATSCFSPIGRNRTCGERLGRGESLDEILASTVSIVEGVPTTRSVVKLARRERVEMPITEAVHRILFADLSPRDAITMLMEREPKPERVG